MEVNLIEAHIPNVQSFVNDVSTMIDWIITQTILSSIKDQSNHHVVEVTLFVLYLVVGIAAVITAASMKKRNGECSAIIIAVNSPIVYFTLLPFGVLS